MYRRERRSMGLKQSDVVRELQTIEPRMTVPIYSLVETGVVRPTLKQLKIMNRLFMKNVNLQDIVGREPDIYKLTVRVPAQLMEGFEPMLKEWGYKGISDWLITLITNMMAIKRK
jgi:hypothetical protein